MHAVRIHQFGDDSVLRYEEVPDPQPGPGEVRVAVQAASINRGDLARRSGTYPGEVELPAHARLGGRRDDRRGWRRGRSAPRR